MIRTSILNLFLIFVCVLALFDRVSSTPVEDVVALEDNDNQKNLAQQDQPYQQMDDDRELSERGVGYQRNSGLVGRQFQMKRQQYWSKCQHSPLTCLLRK